MCVAVIMIDSTLSSVLDNSSQLRVWECFSNDLMINKNNISCEYLATIKYSLSTIAELINTILLNYAMDE